MNVEPISLQNNGQACLHLTTGPKYRKMPALVPKADCWRIKLPYHNSYETLLLKRRRLFFIILSTANAATNTACKFFLAASRRMSLFFITVLNVIHIMDKADIIGNIELLLAAKSTLNANQHESAGQIRAMLAFCIAMTQALPADRNSINAAFAVAAERFRPNEANAPKSVEHFDAVCELLTTALLVPSGISLPLGDVRSKD